MKNISKLKKVLFSSKNILVVSHTDPDYDSVGSMIALFLLLKKLGKRVVMYSEDKVPNAYAFLPKVRYIKNKIPNNKKFDITFTVDSADILRVGTKINLKKISKLIVNIDHHSDNTFFGDLNFVEFVSSTAEIVYKLCKKFNVKITKDIATSLYTAILTDTGSFRYDNTKEQTFRIASELVKSGASPNFVSTKIYDTRSMVSLKLLSKTLQKSKTKSSGRVIWSSLSAKEIKSLGAKDEDFIGIVDAMRSFEKAEVAILFRETKQNIIKVNLRSKGYVNVQEIAHKFGGGGHYRASGIILSGNLKDIEKKVISEVVRALK